MNKSESEMKQESWLFKIHMQRYSTILTDFRMLSISLNLSMKFVQQKQQMSRVG